MRIRVVDCTGSKMTRQGKIMAFATAALMVALMAPDRALACSCMRPEVEEHLSYADVVFTGELVRVGRPWWSIARWREGSFNGLAIARVDTVFKGDIGSSVEIGYHPHEGACGINLIEGSRGVFLLTSNEGRFGTNLCLFDLDMDVDAIIDVLGEGREPDPDPAD